MECIDGKVAVVLEVCLRHVYVSHTSVEIEPGSSGFDSRQLCWDSRGGS